VAGGDQGDRVADERPAGADPGVQVVGALGVRALEQHPAGRAAQPRHHPEQHARRAVPDRPAGAGMPHAAGQ
jgi:hypothetical protein